MDDTAPMVHDIEMIAAIDEPVLRNLRITQCYSELSIAFGQRIQNNANWCSFATWASKQAGQTIRREDLKKLFREFIQQDSAIKGMFTIVTQLARSAGSASSADRIKQSAAGILVETAVTRASDAISRGNKKVFEEIAPVFSRFLTLCGKDSSWVQSHIDEVCKPLLPGDPPVGQDYLRQAFHHYYQACFETDHLKKDELCLLANLQIGFHEQTRLQPEIAESLQVAMPDTKKLREKILAAIFKENGFWKQTQIILLNFFGKKEILATAVEKLILSAQQPIKRLMTLHLMTLTIPPGKRLRLGQDLQAIYPETLKQLSLTALVSLLEKIDPTPDSLLESGARDWANLPDRMHFIADFFRCYQQTRELFDVPFNKMQVNYMKDGRLPGGDL